jgi:hypothetical protein
MACPAQAVAGLFLCKPPSNSGLTEGIVIFIEVRTFEQMNEEFRSSAFQRDGWVLFVAMHP